MFKRVAVKPFLLLPKLGRNNRANFITLPSSYWSQPKTLTKTKSQSFFSPCRTVAMASSPSLSVQLKENIELTDTEEKIFDRLLGTLRHFGLNNQLRVAGGWVRDKVCGSGLFVSLGRKWPSCFIVKRVWYFDYFPSQLLGKECYDIDIALDNMLGSEFVDKVREYLLSVGEEPQGIAVIPWYVEYKWNRSIYLKNDFMELNGLHFIYGRSRYQYYNDIICTGCGRTGGLGWSGGAEFCSINL